jgi:peptidoglycan/LPS O-acetylase OafA/YrhL
MTRSLRYEPGLVGLRGVVIITVMLFHGYPWRLPGGWVGVDVFFVLSGYLITRLLAEERAATGQIDFLSFYMRRMLRLTPALWAVLLFVSVIFAVGWIGKPAILGVAFSGLYVSNVAAALRWAPENPLSHTWSLSTEEQFYIVWPLVYFFTAKAKPLYAVIAALIAATGWKIYLSLHGVGNDRIYFPPDTHIDPLLVGCGLALLNLSDRTKALIAKSWPVALLGLLAIVFFTPIVNGPMAWLFLPAGVASAILLVAGEAGALKRALSWRPLVFTGKISYGLYLWHYPLNFLVKRHWPHVEPVIPLATSYLVATLSYFTIEAYFRSFRHRFEVGNANEARAAQMEGVPVRVNVAR